MNTKFLLLAFGIAGLTGCATSYKTGQTPDDVYFSPAPKYVERESVKEEEENREDSYYDYRDRATRLKTNNYRRWNSLDNPYYFDGYSYSPSNNYKYNYSYGYSYNYNPYTYNSNGYYGNSYGYGGYSNSYCPYPSGYNYGYNNPRNINLGYKPRYVAPRGGGNTGYSGTNGYSNTNNSPATKYSQPTNGGGTLNRVFNGSSSNNNSSNNSSPVRTYEPSSSSGNSSSGSSSSGSSSGSSGTTRPARNGG